MNPTPENELQLFIDEYVKELRERNAAVFAGAGLSAASGYVNWRGLLKPIAEELGLKVDEETDLVAIAQYHCNKNLGNRGHLEKVLVDSLVGEASLSLNHRILASLPISTFWTTNYDDLIERALREAGKVVDVKYLVPQLAKTTPRRDAVVYKMHGDIQHPASTVVTKDDYEKYFLDRGAFVTALAGDLVAKTFLFLGFSFTDPNLDYILARVRVTFERHLRQHYCIMKLPSREQGQSDEVFARVLTRQELAIQDLRRFGIKTLLVEDYGRITDLLQQITRRIKRRSIFISGSADDYAPWTQRSTEEFLRSLCGALVGKGFRLVTGMGLGIGSAVITGALGQVYSTQRVQVDDALVMRPFPQSTEDPVERAELWEKYRQGMVPEAGIALVLLGNKRVGAEIVPADGVRRECAIARQHGLAIIPIGSSGHVAKEVWEHVVGDLPAYYPDASPELKEKLEALGRPVADPSELIQDVLDMIQLVAKE